MKALVTGAKGQLGFDVIKILEKKNIQYLGIDVDVLDITDELKVKQIISEYKPDVIVHCAAYTAVDKAEDEKEICYSINVLGTKFLAEVCKDINAKMVYISTDYVFDGKKERPYEIADKPDPINFYGKTKYEGELEVQKSLEKYFIVRVSWLFGVNGNNFVKTMLRFGKDRDEISVVADQIGSPTYTNDLAEFIVELIHTDKYGIYHATNEGYCSWYEFASEIFRLAGLNIKVKPISTDDYPTKAKRPKNSRLKKESFADMQYSRLPSWKEALVRFLKESGYKIRK